ncbi:MAG: sulfite exporter TauE/SafE family protein [Bacteroidetes bacterium]|nr:sulfite exporter TauE/SafE family protein [Bacteroidota bacterium]
MKTPMDISTVLILLGIGILAGALSGLAGIGGGIIIVPALLMLLGLTQHQAQGTSLATMLIPIGVFLSVINYHKGGNVNISFAILIAVGFIGGSFLGSSLAIKLDQQMLRRIFGLILAVISIKYLFGK